MNETEIEYDLAKKEQERKQALSKAISVKFYRVKTQYDNLDKRSNPRPPYKLKWLLNLFTKDYAVNEINKSDAIDKMAKAFCALEDFESWIERAKEGAKKFQKEMEKQSIGKITRLETFASMGMDGEDGGKIDERDVPF